MSNFRAGKQEITLWFVNSRRPFQQKAAPAFVVAAAIVSVSPPVPLYTLHSALLPLLLLCCCLQTQLKCCDIFCAMAFAAGCRLVLGFLPVKRAVEGRGGERAGTVYRPALGAPRERHLPMRRLDV